MFPDTEAIRTAKAIWSRIGLTILILSGTFLTLFTLYKMSAAVEDVLYRDEYNTTTGCRYDYIAISGSRLCRNSDGSDREFKLICSGDHSVLHFFCICMYVLYAVVGFLLVITWTLSCQVLVVNPLRDIYDFIKYENRSECYDLNIRKWNQITDQNAPCVKDD